MRQLIVNAYPKSGLTWLVHLVCDLLEGVHQDTDQMDPITYDHPVTTDWLIRKVHKPNWGDDIPYLTGKIVVFTQRDPRDVVVSAMHYRGTTDLDAAIGQMINSQYIGWLNSILKPSPLHPLRFKRICTSYERLHFEPVKELRYIILEAAGESVSDERLEEALDRQSFPNMLRQLGGDKHFMRKGIVGDWRNYFNREQAKYFNVHFGEFMLTQGYIENLDWWEDVKV